MGYRVAAWPSTEYKNVEVKKEMKIEKIVTPETEEGKDEPKRD